MTEPPRVTVDALLKRIGLLPERVMRRSEMRQWARFDDPDRVAHQLEEIAQRALFGEGAARLAQMAWLDLLLHADAEDSLALDAIDLAAESAGLRLVVFLLTDPPPHRSLQGPRRNRQTRDAHPLGSRVWKASSADRAWLEKLLADPHPMVVARLCQNPRVREVEIVNIAAKRPNWPDVLDAVARSRWLLASDQVRDALIQNPFARPGLAVNLLPHKGSRFLRVLGYSSDIHPILRDFARYLVEIQENRH